MDIKESAIAFAGSTGPKLSAEEARDRKLALCITWGEALLECRQRLGYRAWGEFLRSGRPNFDGKPVTHAVAYRYMALAKGYRFAKREQQRQVAVLMHAEEPTSVTEPTAEGCTNTSSAAHLPASN